MFFFSSRRRHTRYWRDWSSDVCSSDLHQSSTMITPYLNLLAVLNLLGAAQGFLLALALLTARRGGRAANRLLAALTFVISVFVSGAVLRTTGYVFALPHLAWVHDPFPFAAGPLLYLYMRARTNGARPARRHPLPLAPALLCALYPAAPRSGEGRVGKEWRSPWSPYH